jgi:predicted RNA-binding protein YlxR (DUF448 family)/ribosomal protein L7Ae-like RNA K-turn-binding protein
MNKKMVKASGGFTPGRPFKGGADSACPSVGHWGNESKDSRLPHNIRSGASEERSDVRGPDKIRTCLGCRVSKNKEELVRLMKSPDGIVVIDYKRTLPGRGAYVCPTESCIRDAFSRKQITRVFKVSQIEGVEEFLDRLRKLILYRISSLLSLARKAGKVVDGREAVEKGMEKGTIKLLVFAEDLSPLSFKEMKDICLKRGIVHYTNLSKDEMGGLIGKGERGALGIADESFSSLLGKEFERFKSLGSMGSGGGKNG